MKRPIRTAVLLVAFWVAWSAADFWLDHTSFRIERLQIEPKETCAKPLMVDIPDTAIEGEPFVVSASAMGPFPAGLRLFAPGFDVEGPLVQALVPGFPPSEWKWTLFAKRSTRLGVTLSAAEPFCLSEGYRVRGVKQDRSIVYAVVDVRNALGLTDRQQTIFKLIGGMLKFLTADKAAATP
jgi:hypothetical protein